MIADRLLADLETLYFGFLLAFWMTPTMSLAHLLFACATTAYIVLAIQFEERDPVYEHGVGYEQYRRAVPMLGFRFGPYCFTNSTRRFLARPASVSLVATGAIDAAAFAVSLSAPIL